MAPETPVPLIVPASQDEIDNVRGYRITKWNQYKNYECVYCQYSTLWLDKMNKHQAEDNHVWAYPGQNPTELEENTDEPSYG